LLRYISTVVRRTRDWPAVSLGGSTRATVNLLTASKALATMDGRDYLIPDDVKAASPPVLRHRLLVRPEADLEGVTPDRVVAEVLAGVEVPK
jgi:MoxR-like ATPase